MAMYVGRGGVRELELFMVGWQYAMVSYGMDQPGRRFGEHFASWLRATRGWAVQAGWAKAIERNTEPGSDHLESFFTLAEEFASLKATPVAECRDRADQLYQLVCYKPTGLHFTYRETNGVGSVGYILRDGTGNLEHPLDRAMELAGRDCGGNWEPLG